PEAEPETGDRPPLPDDPVAGDDDRDRVASHRSPDGPGRPRIAHALRELPVGHGVARRTLAQFLPDRSFERRGGVRFDLEVELLAGPLEVLPELARGTRSSERRTPTHSPVGHAGLGDPILE